MSTGCCKCCMFWFGSATSCATAPLSKFQSIWVSLVCVPRMLEYKMKQWSGKSNPKCRTVYGLFPGHTKYISSVYQQKLTVKLTLIWNGIIGQPISSWFWLLHLPTSNVSCPVHAGLKIAKLKNDNIHPSHQFINAWTASCITCLTSFAKRWLLRK